MLCLFDIDLFSIVAGHMSQVKMALGDIFRECEKCDEIDV